MHHHLLQAKHFLKSQVNPISLPRFFLRSSTYLYYIYLLQSSINSTNSVFLKSDEESDTTNNETNKGKGFLNEHESLVKKMRRFSVSALQVHSIQKFINIWQKFIRISIKLKLLQEKRQGPILSIHQNKLLHKNQTYTL